VKHRKIVQLTHREIAFTPLNIIMSAHDTQPLGVLPLHDILPKYMSAFDSTMHTYLDTLEVHSPSPADRSGSYDYVSALVPPFREEETTLQDEDVSPDGIPAHLKDHDASRTRMRLVRLRTYLMRCEVLQSTVNSLERKPWTQDSNRDSELAQLYSNIRNSATKAKGLAEALQSRDLQARCEYWAGRGCGGLKDWQAALTHFSVAIKLDVPDDTFAKGDPRPRGLLQHEKNDVEFLLKSVTERHETWLLKSEEARKASQVSEATQGPLEEVDWEEMRGPSWIPDRDRMYHIAQRQFAKKKLGVKRRSRMVNIDEEETPLGKDEVAAVNQRLEIADDRQVVRRVLSAEEWRYILHGDESTKKRSENMKRKSSGMHHQPPADRQRQHSKTSYTSYTSSAAPSSNNSSTHHTPEMPNLASELDGLLNSDDSESLSPEQTSRSPSSQGSPTPSAAGSLQQRRNLKLKLPPISTSKIRKDARLDGSEAVQGVVSSPTKSNKSEGEMVEVVLDDYAEEGAGDFASYWYAGG
jgi:hypothetical protein